MNNIKYTQYFELKGIENVSRNLPYPERIRGFPGKEIFKKGPDEQRSEVPAITSCET